MEYTGSGTILIGSLTSSEVAFSFDSDNTVSWDFQRDSLSWFKVEGSCNRSRSRSTSEFQPSNPKPGEIDNNNPCKENQSESEEEENEDCEAEPCTKVFFTNVLATDPQDVCRKIRKRGILRRINSIRRLPQSPSISRNRENNIEDSVSCSKDVTPSFEQDVTPNAESLENCPDCEDCIEFFIDQTADITVCVDSEAIIVFGAIGAGTISLSGMNSPAIFSGSGLIVLSGEALVVSPSWSYTGGGLIIVDGEAGLGISKNYTGSGTIVIGSQTQLSFSYDGSGTILLSGAANSSVSLSYEGSGDIIVDGSFSTESSSYSYVGSGLIVIDSQTTYSSSDLGTLDIIIEGDLTIESVGAIFDITLAPEADVSNLRTVTVSSCCPIDIPTVFSLSHNLNNISSLSKFLQRNNFVLPGVIETPDLLKLQYNQRTDSWQGNIGFIGKSHTSTNQNSWNLSFDLTCSDNVSLRGFSENVWKFSLLIVNKDLVTGKKIFARLLTVFSIDTFCGGDMVFNGFEFSFNINTLSSSPSTMVLPVYHDGNGIFGSSKGFIDNPVIIFRLRPLEFLPLKRQYRQFLEEQLSATKEIG